MGQPSRQVRSQFNVAIGGDIFLLLRDDAALLLQRRLRVGRGLIGARRFGRQSIARLRPKSDGSTIGIKNRV
jgi:hypothetical protein